jgi:LPS O-antigen subunit length determinant protein (WzzB/FepE family)
MSDEWRLVLLILGLGAAALLVIAASAELAVQADRADTATNLAEVAAWQVSQVLDEVRRITRESAARQSRGELP